MGKKRKSKKPAKRSTAKPNTALKQATERRLSSISKGSSLAGTSHQTIKMAVWGASPYVITGFGEVMRKTLTNLFRLYPKQYEVYQVGINFVQNDYNPDYVTGGPQNGVYKQWPALPVGGTRMHVYGQKRFLDLLGEILPVVDLDLIFIAEDPFIIGGQVPGAQQPVTMMDAIKYVLAQHGKSHIPIVAQYPLDGQPKVEWLNEIAKVDFPVTYLRFAKQMSEAMCPALKGRVSVIPLGADTSEFFPIPRSEARTFKRAMFGEQFADKFMFMNVNRNQLRKMIPSTLVAYKHFKQKVPDDSSFLYMNMKLKDVGWDLLEVCKAIGLRVGVDVLFPPEFEVQKGLSLADLNKVFNCADCLVTTAIGGGWELCVTQAFSTKTTVIAPANTSHIELCGKQTLGEARGILYKSGSNLAQVTVFSNDNDVPRPLPDLDDMVEKMAWVYNNQDTCREMEDRSLDWVHKSLNWGTNVVPHFHGLFQAAARKKRLACGQIQEVVTVPEVPETLQPLTPPTDPKKESNIFVGTTKEVDDTGSKE